MKFYVILPYILQAVAWPLAHFIFRINGTFTVHGYENIKNLKGPIIIASNHPNEIDPVVQRAIFPMFSKFGTLFWVARLKSIYAWKGWRSILFGDWFFKSWGAYPAYKGFNDYDKSLKHIIKILNGGNSVAVYPQGGKGMQKSEDESRSLQVHGGIAFLSQKTKTPIIPILIKGTQGTNLAKLFFKKSKIDMYILPPVRIPEAATDYKFEARKIMDRIYSAEVTEEKISNPTYMDNKNLPVNS